MADIGGYRVVRLLGKGGMAEVYEVEHPTLGVRRAMKVFRAGGERAEMLRSRFLAEGTSLPDGAAVGEMLSLARERLAGTGAQWFTAPAEVPDALYFAGFSKEDANPDIGDSAITETGRESPSGVRIEKAEEFFRACVICFGRMVTRSSQVSGITLGASPAWMAPTVTTAMSLGSISRERMVCIPVDSTEYPVTDDFYGNRYRLRYGDIALISVNKGALTDNITDHQN